MARVTANEVKAIIPTSLDDAVVDVHITSANDLVSDIPTGLSSTRLTQIELYLSAHFVAVQDEDVGNLREKEIDGTRASYGGELAQALKFTKWGQQALALDTTGYLLNLGKQRARFNAFGPTNF